MNTTPAIVEPTLPTLFALSIHEKPDGRDISDSFCSQVALSPSGSVYSGIPFATVISDVAEKLPTVAVRVAVPRATGVTTPSSETVNTDSSLLCHIAVFESVVLDGIYVITGLYSDP